MDKLTKVLVRACEAVVMVQLMPFLDLQFEQKVRKTGCRWVSASKILHILLHWPNGAWSGAVKASEFSCMSEKSPVNCTWSKVHNFTGCISCSKHQHTKLRNTQAIMIRLYSITTSTHCHKATKRHVTACPWCGLITKSKPSDCQLAPL